MLLNAHHSFHSEQKQKKSCAAVQPDAQLVTMVIFHNATGSQSLPLVHHHLNELQTLHTNEGRGKNGSTGFHKVLGSPKTPPKLTHTHTHTQGVVLHQLQIHHTSKKSSYLDPVKLVHYLL